MTATTSRPTPSHPTPSAKHAAAPAGDGREALVLPFEALDRTQLEVAGGKVANLGELLRAGLPVPPGFCVTTRAYALVAAGAGLEPVLAALERAAQSDTPGLAALAAQARDRLMAAPVPEAAASAITHAYTAMTGDGSTSVPVAVRSSATAEDLPTASFAGQQDTYLNVVGAEAVLDAVRRCWASLWTDRAVAYRASNGIDHRAVQLAVAVQEMVPSAVAGVMFTANPLTGRRRQAVIDASPGLGEAVVSGAVTPDHFVVDVDTGAIVERDLGDKRFQIVGVPGGGTRREDLASTEACLSDAQLQALALLAAQVETHYGAPQDTEWALDPDGRLWLVQSRPITTLHPLPTPAPADPRDLRVYLSFNVAQGVFRPLTPMGMQGFRLISAGLASMWGFPPRDPARGASIVAEAAGRLYLDVTALVRTSIGRRVARFAFGHMEARSAALLDQLFADSRLSARPVHASHVLPLVAGVLLKTGAPAFLARALSDPEGTRQRFEAQAARALALGEVPDRATPAQRLDALQRMLVEGPPLILPTAITVLLAAFGSYGLAGRLLGRLATHDELQTVRRGLAHNTTTEMDLALWALSQRVRADDAAAEALRTQAPDALSAAYRQGSLPAALQEGVRAFLARYGHRGVAEIDLGVPRWRDDPAHILGALANYLQQDDPAHAPDAQFHRGAAQAEAMVQELTRRARRRSPLHGAVVRFCLRRVRDLSGLRESPKFHVVELLARARTLLQEVAPSLVAAGTIQEADDVFFLTLPEVRAALAGADCRGLARARREEYERELHRRLLPRILLSDGTEPELLAPAGASADGVLRGAPASAGVITGTARVILDPEGARLEPGEILVAPSTDPGWTPLFLTAGALVMEMGGPMSHGAVVAREYGIPAVVGVPGATERIRTGDRITVDGSAGTIAPA